ncbi:malonic semialdehyde reductase [Roseomonas gilardii]|uniref:Putative NADH dehydrogenase/NAD(P)H nitroreductase RGI145_01275 n=1 Tax=Roseomonas gilardii TaxID=257708 RepID=A0A1L7AAX3_9PROT|nr:malonic semialdehyde reductase [Roseomonas gilardii]APT55945.1 malonic semialdehyde reductase [Roseomonas gilardii]
MPDTIDTAALDRIFRTARSQNKWQDRPVSEAQLRKIYDLLKLGPTAGNSSPARFVFVTSPEGKEKLRPALSSGNLEKTMSAPVVAIAAYDLDFTEQLPKLFPHMDARPWYADPEVRQVNAFRNGSLQAAYLIVAARAVGLDAGPMSGFNNALVDEAFFAGTRIKSNMLVNLGYGDPAGVRERLPRLSFEEACRIA